ncbi:hypothetical protein [Streptomyces sp. NPDC053079]|uniref:hypothetical protein n=1 Tax=Streptomyces sp. NPDC053079 TaxID=3365697 RepID=UPI0037CE83EA
MPLPREKVGGVIVPVTVSPVTPSMVWVTVLPSTARLTLWLVPLVSVTVPGCTVAIVLPSAALTWTPPL